MKKILFAVLVGAVIITAGCVSTVSDTHSPAIELGPPTESTPATNVRSRPGLRGSGHRYQEQRRGPHRICSA